MISCRTGFFIVLFWVLGAGASSHARAEDWPWGRTVFRSDFELAELEDRERKRIPTIGSSEYLRDWTQRVRVPDLPRFMEGALVRHGAGDGGRRHLELPFGGSQALLVARVGSGHELMLVAGARLRATVRARWSALGRGSWRLELVAGDETVTLLTGRGAQEEWRRLESTTVVPESLARAELRIVLESPPGQVGGNLAIDDVELVLAPRLEWQFPNALRRISPRDTDPIAVASVGISPGTYEIRFVIESPAGEILWKDRQDRLVMRDQEFRYGPRLDRWESKPSRGVYTARVELESRDDGKILRDERIFVLAGPSEFPRVLGGRPWGIERGHDEIAPWMAAADADRVLIPATGRVTLPRWLENRPEIERGVLVTVPAGEESKPPTLDALLSDLRRIYWGGPDTAEARAQLARWLETAPYLVTGFAERPGQTPAGEPALWTVRTRDELQGRPSQDAWEARLDLSNVEASAAADELAALLYLATTAGAEAVYLVAPDEVFLAQGSTGWEPRATILAWEFVTGFLSSARFQGAEPWDGEGDCLVFERDGEEFLVVMAARPHTLLLEGQQVTVYSSTGIAETVAADLQGQVPIPVDPRPRLVRGLDLPRVRTLRSLRARIDGDGARRGDQRIVVSIHNHFAEPVRAALVLEIPEEWELVAPLGPLRLEADRPTEAAFRVRVPPSLGIDGPVRLAGSLEIERADGTRSSSPVELPIPLESPLIQIRALGVGAEDADVTVSNRSDDRLRFTAHLYVTESGNEITRYQQILDPGESGTYSIRYPGWNSPRELWVGITTERPQTYINQKFSVPGRP